MITVGVFLKETVRVVWCRLTKLFLCLLWMVICLMKYGLDRFFFCNFAPIFNWHTARLPYFWLLSEWLLLLLFWYMQVPCLNFRRKCTPLWVNCMDGTILCYLLILDKLELPDISYYLSQGRYLIHIFIEKNWKSRTECVRIMHHSFFAFLCFGVMRCVTGCTSAFLACHECYCAALSLAWSLNLRALVYNIFWSLLPGVFSWYSGFLPSFIG